MRRAELFVIIDFSDRLESRGMMIIAKRSMGRIDAYAPRQSFMLTFSLRFHVSSVMASLYA